MPQFWLKNSEPDEYRYQHFTMHIDHINISAPMNLLEKVKDFYCCVLDLEEGFRPRFSQRGFWLYAKDKPIVHLTENLEHHSCDGQGYLDHVAFQASSLNAVIENLESLGIEYRSTHIPEIRMTQLFFKDPAGTGIEVNFLEGVPSADE